MDHMLNPPEPPPEPSDDDIAAAVSRLIDAAYKDPTRLLEEIDPEVILDAFVFIRAGAQASAAEMIDKEVSRILISDKAIKEELEKTSHSDDGPDNSDDYMIDEAAAFGGRNYP